MNSKRVESVLLIVLIVALPATLVSSTTNSQQTTTAPLACVEGGTSGPTVPPNLSVAVVKPIFTSTPYSQYAYGSFYAFYKKYRAVSGNITTDLRWLNTSVKSGMKFNSGWGHTYPLYSFLKSDAAKSCGLVFGKTLHIISDINITDGALFNPNGTRMYDAIIIGHEEYVTQKEYDQLRLFVAMGGRLIAVSSNQFYAKVEFNPITQAETFVIGHSGFAFNGRTAWHDKLVRTPWNASGWFGSVYCCFHRFHYKGGIVNQTNPVGSLLSEYFGAKIAPTYNSHEENAVSNFSQTSIIAKFTNQSGLTVASYIHHFGRGVVICLCIFGEDLLGYERSTQYFVVASIAANVENSSRPPIGAFPLFVPIIVTALALAVLAIPIFILLRRRGQ